MRLRHVRPDTSPAPAQRSLRRQAWQRPAAVAARMTGPERFHFLNQERSLDDAGWDDPGIPLLWRYNLHYFEDLVARGADERSAWHEALIQHWIAENPPGQGTGWAPYPTSLRIVNWIRWALAGNDLGGEALHSLAIQTRWLMQRLEWHLLGNHLFANAKALLFAGLFFEGEEAEGWLRTGLRILQQEIPEQILPDGGHFELSTMYHALACVDMLDMLNLLHCVPQADQGRVAALQAMLRQRLPDMLRWLAVMTHPDGEIAFFNDAAFGIAPAPAEIHAYARRLGIASMEGAGQAEGIVHLAESGYIRANAGPASLFIDVAEIGPSYIPGHAHADTLSFELSIAEQRVLVNGGTSTYAAGRKRQQQRGTAMHNTVVVAGQNSSEVWGSFRVARRARPFGLQIAQGGDNMRIRCCHDGYRRLPGRPVHDRTWEMNAQGLFIGDMLKTGQQQQATALFRFHPALSGAVESDVSPRHPVFSDDRLTVAAQVRQGMPSVLAGQWHPGFGEECSCALLAVDLQENISSIGFKWKE